VCDVCLSVGIRLLLHRWILLFNRSNLQAVFNFANAATVQDQRETELIVDLFLFYFVTLFAQISTLCLDCCHAELEKTECY